AAHQLATAPLPIGGVVGAGIASDGTYVYFMSEGAATAALHRCTANGTDPAVEQLAGNLVEPSWTGANFLTSSQGLVYWAGANAVSDVSAKTSSTAMFATADGVEQVVSDSANVYFSTKAGKAIQSCPSSATCTSPTTIIDIADSSRVELLAVDAGYLYW